MDRGLVTQCQTPSLLPAESDLPKPITQMEKEKKDIKNNTTNNGNTASSEICRALILRGLTQVALDIPVFEYK